MKDHQAETVSIVGSGQVGTMLGLALMASGADVTLYDRDPATSARSLARGAGRRIAATLAEALHGYTVILAMPVSEIVTTLQTHRGELRDGALVLDTGSTKASVVEALRALPHSVHAIGGHPLAGTERPGPDGADVTALSGASFALCPARSDAVALERARALVVRMGARPVVIEAAEHDCAVARTSGLPHLLAFALAIAAKDQPVELAASGYRGATRLAASDPRMVASFLVANADEVRVALADLRLALERLAAKLDDEDELAAELARAAS